jgi:uncharacterized protein DUF5946
VTQARACPGCGLMLAVGYGPVHPYIGASAACWALYGELTARAFARPEYLAVHQMTVDAYAVQHPGGAERRAVQSVALHLMTLCLWLERDGDPRDGPRLHRRMVRRPIWHWLDPPDLDGRMTVRDALGARDLADPARGVGAWAGDVWAAWSPHHDTVRRWLERCLG